MKRGEQQPGRKEAEKRLATDFPSKRKRARPFLRAAIKQKRMTKQEWSAFRGNHSASKLTNSIGDRQ